MVGRAAPVAGLRDIFSITAMPGLSAAALTTEADAIGIGFHIQLASGNAAMKSCARAAAAARAMAARDASILP